jgi:hypothetical protein
MRLLMTCSGGMLFHLLGEHAHELQPPPEAT